jgi:hypothetical protein
VLLVHQLIPQSSEFPVFMKRLRENITEYVKEIETTKRQEHSDYIEGEIEKERASREAQFEEDLMKMGQVEAEKRRKIEEERNEAERRRREDAARYEFERQQREKMTDAQNAQQKEYTAALLAVQERSDRQRNELWQQMLQDNKDRDARLADQHLEELRLQGQRELALQQQIQQLIAREPVVVHSDSRVPWGEIATAVTTVASKAEGCNVS